jgi:hypothetical protein
MAQCAAFKRYKPAVLGLASLFVINWLLSIATKSFVILAQRHLSHELSGVLLIVLAIFVLFLIAATLLLSIKLFEGANIKVLREQRMLATLSFALTINFGYWLLAVFMSDSACVKCGGYSQTLYFWINPHTLNE